MQTNNSLQVSANGFVSLGRRYTTDVPNMGAGYDVLAPFWTDIDFRYSSSGGVAYSQHRNTDTDSFSQMIIEKTSSYISARANTIFYPNLVILVTWIKALPHPAYFYAYSNKTATFQLNLATNGHSTYASYIYDDGGMLWKDVIQNPHVGYSINGQILDMTLGQTGLYPYYRFDAVVGNTGRTGEWMWDVINFPLKILSPKHLILFYGEVNNFEINATSAYALTLTYSIHANGTSANVNSTTGKVSMYVNSSNVTIKFIVKDEQNQTIEFQPTITLCYCLNGASCNSSIENPNATSSNPLLTYAKCNCKLGYTGEFCEQGRMFPYKKTNFLQNTDDGYRLMTVNPGIQVGSTTHTQIFVSANGLISLGRQYTPYVPNMGSGYDVLAPFWTDIDFSYSSSGGVAYSQHRNTDTDTFSQMIIEKTGSYISARANISFSPNLVILVTWIKAFPYPASTYRNTNKTATFQLNLATNGRKTYASYIYDDGSMLWKDVGRTPHVGYSINGQILDMTLGQTGLYPYYRFDAVVGNTGRKGEWMWDVINLPSEPLILSPKHLILSYGEVNIFEIKATSPIGSTLTYSIHANGTSANINSTNGKVSMYVNSPHVAIKLIVKDEQNQTIEFQPTITLCYCLNGASCNSSIANPDATSSNRLLTYAKCNCKLGYTGAFCEQQEGKNSRFSRIYLRNNSTSIGLLTTALNQNKLLFQDVSANGVISLGRWYTTYTYVPNMGSGYDVLAPFWTDLDFRYSSSGGLAYSQHRNTDTDSFSQTLIEKTGSYISARANINFSPNLVILVTWIKAFPYPASTYRNTNKTATFQLSLATNGRKTYASYIYDDGGMLLKDVGRTPHVGYSINGKIIDMTLGQTGLYPYYRFDAVVGNTGRKGEWMWDVINLGGKNRLVCKDTSMEIYLDPRTVISNLTIATLRNSSCTMKRYLPSNEYGFVTGFKECGTTVVETASHIIYENEVNWRTVSGGITRSNVKKILFSCSMSRHSDVNVNQFTAPISMVNETDEGYGSFTITLSMFMAADFSAKVSGFPAIVALNSRIYFESLVTSEDQSVVLLFEKCVASPTMDKNNPSKYNLISNRCGVDSTLQFHSSANPHKARFSFQSFTFAGQNTAVFLHCQVFMCHKQSTDSRCTTGCQGNNIHRVRRSIDKQLQHQSTKTHSKSIERREIPVEYMPSKEISLSIGPLVQQSNDAKKANGPGDKAGNAKGFTAVHGMGVGLGVLGLVVIGFAVGIMSKRMLKKKKRVGVTNDAKQNSNEGFELEAQN
eukprot:gene17962-19759_t